MGGNGDLKDELASIMIFQLDNKQGFFFNFVNEAVFLIYSSGPITGKGVPERFWFSFSFIRISANVFDKLIDSFKSSLIFFLPGEVVFPGLIGKNDFHSISFLSFPLPSSSSLIDSSRRCIFRGLRRR